MIFSQTVVLPEAEPPVTPMMKGPTGAWCGGCGDWERESMRWASGLGGGVWCWHPAVRTASEARGSGEEGDGVTTGGGSGGSEGGRVCFEAWAGGPEGPSIGRTAG